MSVQKVCVFFRGVSKLLRLMSMFFFIAETRGSLDLDFYMFGGKHG